MNSTKKTPSYSKTPSPSKIPPPKEDQIPLDGFKQVLEMLRVADPEFRESLLQRLAVRDQNLVKNLRRGLQI